MFIPELEALPIKILKKEEYFVFSLFFRGIQIRNQNYKIPILKI